MIITTPIFISEIIKETYRFIVNEFQETISQVRFLNYNQL